MDTFDVEQYRFWVRAGMNHLEMFEALEITPPTDTPTRNDVLEALQWGRIKLAYIAWRER